MTVKLLLCAIISCGSAKLLSLAKGSSLMFFVSIFLAAVIYLVLIIATKCITKEEFLGKEKI